MTIFKGVIFVGRFKFCVIYCIVKLLSGINKESIQKLLGYNHTKFKPKFDILFNRRPKDLESNRNIVSSDSLINENLKEIEYLYQLFSLTLAFKSSDGSQNEMGERVQTCKLEQSNLIGWNWIYRGDLLIKMGSCKWRIFSQKNRSKF